MEPNRQRLTDHMIEQATELRLSWREVARRAGMTEQNLRRVRVGDISVTENAAEGIENALSWQPGSVRAILSGGKPTLRVPGPRNPDEKVLRVVTMTPEELAARYVDVRKDLGADEAQRYLAAAIRLREEWIRATQGGDCPSTGGSQDRAG